VRARALLLTVPLVAALAACGSSGSPTTPAGGARLTGTLTVFAAASLTESFDTIGKQFEAAHPGGKVTFNYGASSMLATQINQGAPADVFASAASKNMDQVGSAGNAGSSTTFAVNRMEVAVPASNPAQITSLADLTRPGVKVALCQDQVPCGATAAKVFSNAHISVTPVTQEPDVKSTLAKVIVGEVDAGVVYVTDVRAAGDKVTGIAIPDAQNATTDYPIAALTHARNAALAAAFVSYVESAAGKAVLTAAGFGSPQ
jgi:molybdate transport system substrate-binding protein